MYKPADDLIEEIAAKLESSTVEVKEAHLRISAKDVRAFTSMRCCQEALLKVCDVESGYCALRTSFLFSTVLIDVTKEIVVYRLSHEKTLGYFQGKVDRISKADTMDSSRIITRNLAKEALMDDGNEALFECAFCARLAPLCYR